MTDELVGVSEIARRLGVSQQAVSAWIARGWPPGKRGAKPVKPPKPIGPTVSRVTAFRWRDVERWARATGRLS
jgi:transposase-like protein